MAGPWCSCGGQALLGARRGAGGPAGAERVAVLPFENLGLPTTPTSPPASRTRSWDVSRRFAAWRSSPGRAPPSTPGTTKSTRQIGSELEVRYLLTGTVRWARGQGAAERVRITPQLIRVADDTSLWAEIYEFTMDDIFRVQSEIARSVVSRARPHAARARARLARGPADRQHGSLPGVPARQVPRRATPLHALDLAFRGRRLRACGRSGSRLRAGLGGACEEPIRDSSTSATTSPLRGTTRRDRPWTGPASSLPALRRWACAAGYYHLWVERDPAAALAEFEAASRGLPNSVEVQAAMGELFRLRGDWPRALDAFRAASSLSPRDGSAMVDVAETLWWMRRYPEAVEAADRAIALAPDQAWSYLTKVFALWSWKGRDGLAEARAALEFVPKDHEWAEWTWFAQEELEGRYAEAIGRMEADPEGWIRIKIQAAPKAALCGGPADIARGDGARPEGIRDRAPIARGRGASHARGCPLPQLSRRCLRRARPQGRGGARGTARCRAAADVEGCRLRHTVCHRPRPHLHAARRAREGGRAARVPSFPAGLDQRALAKDGPALAPAAGQSGLQGAAGQIQGKVLIPSPESPPRDYLDFGDKTYPYISAMP